MKKTTFRFNIFSSLFLVLFGFLANAQEKVLVFTKTNGFTHASINAGVSMIEDLGQENELWSTDTTADASAFTTENLAQYAAVIWCNTSGDDLLNDTQQAAFEDFIANGGGFVGIHAATDTYRNGSWTFYNELVGGIIQDNPNHTANNYAATMTVVNSHPAVDFLNGTYSKNEEYYYWELNGGYLFPQNINLLEVEATGTESYDAARPISWYKEYMGGRSFYTALGHNASDYTQDTNFIKHVEEGIKYVIGATLGLGEVQTVRNVSVFPNPAQDKIQIASTQKMTGVRVIDLQGRNLIDYDANAITGDVLDLDCSGWKSGTYFIRVQNDQAAQVVRVIKK